MNITNERGTPLFLADTIEAKDGSQFTIHFFKHSSFAIEVGGKTIYSDPVSGFAPYDKLPKADLIVVSHSHYDHLDTEAIDKIWKEDTIIVCDHTSADMIKRQTIAVKPTDRVDTIDWIQIEAVAAYNTSDESQAFHPKERGDCGYVLTIGGTRVYIAGDGEVTPEMKSLSDIDIAFLPVNQPYTMTEDQVVEAVEAIRPTIFYPYHYGQVEHQTDIDDIVARLSPITDVRVRDME